MAKKKQGNFLPQLRMEDIKKKHLLVTNGCGTVRWENPYVDFVVDFSLNNVCITETGGGFLYLESITYHSEGRASAEKIGKTISLKSTPCRFGGKRMWFVCPGCKKQSGVLFVYENEIACRKCHNLSYRSQNTRNRITPLYTLDKLRDAVGKTTYRGKPTKTYLRYIKRRKQTFDAFETNMDSLSKRLERVKP